MIRHQETHFAHKQMVANRAGSTNPIRVLNHQIRENGIWWLQWVVLKLPTKENNDGQFIISYFFFFFFFARDLWAPEVAFFTHLKYTRH